MLKKVLIALAAASTLLLAFSCAKEEKPVVSGNQNNDNISTEIQMNENGEVIKDDNYYFSDLSTERYDGYNFRIMVRKTQQGTQYFE